MNNRVKQLREELGLSGTEFGRRIGLKRSTVSQIETGKHGITDANFRAICREYNVSEEWLRTGEGSMFVETKASYLAEVQKQFNLSDFDVNLLKNYIELPADDRELITDFLTACAQKSQDEKD